MIVGSAQAREDCFVITMSEHAEFAENLARAFGNERFKPVEPREEMLYIVDHHDVGWKEMDGSPQLRPETRLPYDLVPPPVEEIVKTSARSPDFNEKHHPFALPGSGKRLVWSLQR